MATYTIDEEGQGTLSRHTPPGGPSRLELRLAWARETLGVAAGATQAEVRGAFLAGLALDEFMPRETWNQAYQTLVNEFEGVIDVTDPAEFLRHEAEQLDEQIEKFAGRMFSLPIDAREREHENLCRRCLPESRALARLESLRPGLAANPAEVGLHSPIFSALAGNLVDLFTLRPSERAARRFEIIESLEPEIAKWETAARIFKTQQPTLATLDESLLDTLATWNKVEERVRLPVIQTGNAVTARTIAAGKTESNRMIWLLIVLGFLFFGAVMRGMSGSSISYAPKLDPKQFEYRPPDFRLREERVPSAKELDDVLKRLREQSPKVPELNPSPDNPLNRPEIEGPSPKIDFRDLYKLREPLPENRK